MISVQLHMSVSVLMLIARMLEAYVVHPEVGYVLLIEMMLLIMDTATHPNLFPFITGLTCIMPRDAGTGGTGGGTTLRYYYNSITSQCETFYYGGVGGNANNFES